MAADPLDELRQALVRFDTFHFGEIQRQQGIRRSSLRWSEDGLNENAHHPTTVAAFTTGWDGVHATVMPFTADMSTCDGPDVCTG